jgi:hypothetical protein
MKAAAEPRAKPAPEVESKAHSGLCETCNHAQDCSYIRNTEQPVVFCEEFDCCAPPITEEVQAQVTAPTAEDMRKWDEYKGLCVNCDLRETCALRNSEIGIWHCEEYQ